MLFGVSVLVFVVGVLSTLAGVWLTSHLEGEREKRRALRASRTDVYLRWLRWSQKAMTWALQGRDGQQRYEEHQDLRVEIDLVASRGVRDALDAYSRESVKGATMVGEALQASLPNSGYSEEEAVMRADTEYAEFMSEPRSVVLEAMRADLDVALNARYWTVRVPAVWPQRRSRGRSTGEQ